MQGAVRDPKGRDLEMKQGKNEPAQKEVFSTELSPNQLYPFLTHATHFLRNVCNFSDMKCSLEKHVCSGLKSVPY